MTSGEGGWWIVVIDKQFEKGRFWSMALTKGDLSAIRGIVKEEAQTTTRQIVREELVPVSKKIDRNFIYLKNRFDELFDFLDKK